MKIYVAGPYSAKDARCVQMNVNKAISIGCQLMRKGWTPFIPHLSHYIWTHPGGDFEYKKWTEMDFEWLDVCDAFYLIDHSPGADAELERAKELKLKIYYNLESVPVAKP
jgi:leucyl-tRNA synthetase